jgi:hypothetical protein
MIRLAPSIKITRRCGHRERLYLPRGETFVRWAMVVLDAKEQPCAACR